MRYPDTIDSPSYDRLIRLWILRLLVPLGGSRELLHSYGFSDDALANYLGIDFKDSPYDVRAASKVLRGLWSRAESSRYAHSMPGTLQHNLDRVGALLSLDGPSKAVLGFAVLVRMDPWLQRAARHVGRVGPSELIEVLSCTLGIDRDAVRGAVAPRSALQESGLLRCAPRGAEDLRDALVLISDHAADRMLHVEVDVPGLLEDVVMPAKAAELRVNDFRHLPLLPVLRKHLRLALDRRAQGVNVLVHGIPGSGKTQFAAALAGDLGCSLHCVTSQDASGNAIDGEMRLRAYKVAQAMLREQRALLLFDEVEDVFDDAWPYIGDKSTAQSRKAWVNRLLEENGVPAIWLTNSVSCMDPAFVRRFDVVVEMTLPSERAREDLIAKSCPSVDAALRRRLTRSPFLSPAMIRRAAKVAEAACEIAARSGAEALLHLINGTLKAQGHAPVPMSEPPYSIGTYDPELVATDLDLCALRDGLKRTGTGRLCLYGPPGTGKTAFGRWLAGELDRPLHDRRASDLLSPYVGMTERSIAEAFQQAEVEGAVLLIDEIDGLLQDRRQARQSWEVTAVNELLVQLEEFGGVFLGATNLDARLDPAVWRRFDAKVHFGYLSSEQAWRLVLQTCQSLGLAAPTTRCLLSRLAVLTPGDCAAIARRHRLHPFPDGNGLVDALAAECALKEVGRSRPIGFHVPEVLAA